MKVLKYFFSALLALFILYYLSLLVGTHTGIPYAMPLADGLYSLLTWIPLLSDLLAHVLPAPSPQQERGDSGSTQGALNKEGDSNGPSPSSPQQPSEPVPGKNGTAAAETAKGETNPVQEPNAATPDGGPPSRKRPASSPEGASSRLMLSSELGLALSLAFVAII